MRQTSPMHLFRPEGDLDRSLKGDESEIGMRLVETLEVWEYDEKAFDEGRPVDKRLISQVETGRKFVFERILDDEQIRPDYPHVIVYRPDDFAALVYREVEQ